MTQNNDFKQEYGEFKGSTAVKLDMIFEEIQGLRKDVNDLKQWKAYVVGITVGVTIIFNLSKDWILRSMGFKQG